MSCAFAADPKTTRRQIAILLAVTFLAWAPSIPNGFVWLDHIEIEQGGYRLLNADDFRKVWSWSLDDFLERENLSEPGPRGSYFRPVYAVANTVSQFLWRDHAWMWHFEAVLWHALVVVLLFLLGRRLGPEKAPAPWRQAVFWATLFFAVHPLGEQSVAWVSGRKDAVCVAFILIALHAYLNAGITSRGRIANTWGALCAGSFLIALGCKELALLLPAFVTGGILAGIFRRPGPSQRALLALLWIAAAAFAVYRAQVVGGFGLGASPPETTLTGRVAMSGSVFFEYVARVLFPRPGLLSDAWPLLGPGLVDPAVIAAFAAACVAIAFTFFKFPQTRLPLLWFCFWLFPASGLAALWHFRAERYLYPASWGLLLAAMLAFHHWLHRRNQDETGTPVWSRVVLVGAGVATLLVTWSALPRWKTDASLFADAAQRDPNHAEAHLMLAKLADREKDYPSAEAHYRKAIAVAKNATHAVYLSPFVARSGLGTSLYRQGRYAESLKEFQRAVAIHPGNAAAHYRVGLVAMGGNDLETAEQAFRKSLALKPHDSVVIANLAGALLRRGDHEGYLEIYEELIAGGWDTPQGLRKYASVLLARERYAEARPIFERITSSDPDDALSLAKLAWCQNALGEKKLARVTLQAALVAEPANPAIRDIARRLSNRAHR